jgi:hypothetical protein|tara:strand:- start:15 stop:197 length:183 start_codon:yes stop_codon:yes gene_type:complete
MGSPREIKVVVNVGGNRTGGKAAAVTARIAMIATLIDSMGGFKNEIEVWQKAVIDSRSTV